MAYIISHLEESYMSEHKYLQKFILVFIQIQFKHKIYPGFFVFEFLDFFFSLCCTIYFLETEQDSSLGKYIDLEITRVFKGLVSMAHKIPARFNF